MTAQFAEVDPSTRQFPDAVRSVVAGNLGDASTVEGAALSATYATRGQVRSKAKTDGTDQTATLQAEINALSVSGGDLLLPTSGFGAVPITINGVLTVPNDGATPPKQAPIRLVGQGRHTSGRGTAPVGGTILDIRGTDTHGKIVTSGLGALEIENVTFTDSAGTTTPFIYTTNTMLRIHDCGFVGSKTGAACNQDAIILGGVNQVEGGGGLDDGFQGYGTKISDNYFAGIRRIAVLQAFANGMKIVDNHVMTTCGNSAGGCIEINGEPTTGVQAATGGTIGMNIIEMPNYKYGIWSKNSTNITYLANDFYDGTAGAGSVAYQFEATSMHNHVIGGFCDVRLTQIVDVSGKSTVENISDSGVASYMQKPQVFSGLTRFVGSVGGGPQSMNVSGDSAYVTATAGPAGTQYTRVFVASRPANSVADGVTTSGSTTVTSASAGFVAGDQYAPIAGAGIPGGALIVQVVDGATVTISSAATATATAVAVTFGRGTGAETQQIEFNRTHIAALGTVPVVAVAAAAGTGATVTIAGADTAGTITLTTGTSPTTGVLVNVTPSIAFSGTQHIVLTPANAAAADASIYAGRANSTLWQIGTGATPPPASTALKFSYHIIQAA